MDTAVAWRARSVDTGEVRLAVREAGDPAGPTIVFVHGYPDSSAVWDVVAARLAPTHHVVLYDGRGMGASTPVRGRRHFRMHQLADDLAAVVDATGGGRPVHLVGHDWGSIQSWETVNDPERSVRVASFTSISGPCLDHVGAWFRRRLRRPTPRNLGQVLNQAVRSTYVLFFQLPVLPTAMWRAGTPRLLRRYLRRVEGIDVDAGYPGPTLAADGRTGVALYRANMLPRLGRRRPSETAVPVQLIVPTRDRYVTAALHADVGRWVPNLRRHDLDAGHWVPRTHPGEVAALIAAHVAANEAGAGITGTRP